MESQAEINPGYQACVGRIAERMLLKTLDARRRVQFPAAGKGAFLQFSPADLTEFEEAWGAAWYSEIEARLLASSPKTVVRCLELGLKRRSEIGDRVIAIKIDPSALGFPLDDAGELILEAITRTVFGKTRSELIAEIETRLAEA